MAVHRWSAPACPPTSPHRKGRSCHSGPWPAGQLPPQQSPSNDQHYSSASVYLRSENTGSSSQRPWAQLQAFSLSSIVTHIYFPQHSIAYISAFSLSPVSSWSACTPCRRVQSFSSTGSCGGIRERERKEEEGKRGRREREGRGGREERKEGERWERRKGREEGGRERGEEEGKRGRREREEGGRERGEEEGKRRRREREGRGGREEKKEGER